jgi:hypothetical protein
LENRQLPSAFTVTNTEDAGPGSLRQAILDANNSPGSNTIAFQIDGVGVQTIQPTSPLPVITNSVILDATTQPGFAGSPLVVLTGMRAGQSANGLTIAADNTRVQGLVINSFGGDGIAVLGVTGGAITGNYIGTDSTGQQAQHNGIGIAVQGATGLQIGGTLAAERNLISGNSSAGVNLRGDSNQILGNYVGTDIRGLAGLSNGIGIYLDVGSANTVGGTAANAGNLISGNGTGGVFLSGGVIDDLVAGNDIGTDVSGYDPLPNGYGVSLAAGATSNLIGGATAAARNVISGNNRVGFLLAGDANFVQGNYVGLTAAGTGGLANQGAGMEITGSYNTIGGMSSGARNVVSANSGTGIDVTGCHDNVFLGNFVGTNAAGTSPLGNGNGIQLNGASGNTFGGTAPGAGNLLSGNNRGIDVGYGTNNDYNVIQGNRIGTDVTGTLALGNTFGIAISGNYNTIGGTAPGAGNLISGNLLRGVDLSGSFNLFQGNQIGTNITGTAAIPNGSGMELAFSAIYNTIGGTSAAARNLISGNHGNGIVVNGIENVLQGNYVGTDSTGTHPLPNTEDGVSVYAGMNNQIGGTEPGAGNLLSGNFQRGIYFYGGTGDSVEGNRIGTDPSGTRAVPNLQGGIFLLGGSSNTIGGTAAGAGNLVSGNLLFGMNIITENNRVQGNQVGTDITGTRALGNGTNGPGMIIGGTNNLIGGTEPGTGNLISGNQGDGLDLGYTNLAQGNWIGIDITGTRALPNGRGVSITGGTPTLGGQVPGAGNVISGNINEGVVISNAGTGVVIQGNRIGTDVQGLRALGNAVGISIASGAGLTIGGTAAGAGNLISGNRVAGIAVAGSSPAIQGNSIGTDWTGTAPLGNGVGITVSGTSRVTIGGTVAGAGNLVSANLGDGLELASNSVVQGNWIGIDASGENALGNGGYGILVQASNNTIGGTAAGAGNVISGNQQDGIALDGSPCTGNLVQGNFIGTDATGTFAVPNQDGITIAAGSTGNTIGGAQSGARNVISGNTNDGVAIFTSGNSVQGNYIGTDVTGSVSVPNLTGVLSLGAIIGGTAVGAGNLISGNSLDGVATSGDNNLIQGNQIGTDADGISPLDNGRNGVNLSSANNTVGGTGYGAGNTIAWNGADGVLVDGATGNTILRNAIYGHANGLGIELLHNGNHGQEFPVLTLATTDQNSTTITGMLTSTPNTAFTIEIFVNDACNPSGYGEGEHFFASLLVTTDDTGSASFNLTVAVGLGPGQFVAATATDPTENTSEFSACVEVTTPASLTLSRSVTPATIALREPPLEVSTASLPIPPSVTEPADRFTGREALPALTGWREASATPPAQHGRAFRLLRAATDPVIDAVFKRWSQSLTDVHC